MIRIRFLTAVAALVVVAAPAGAQEYTMRTATSFNMGGALGIAARLTGGGKESIETSYLSGHKLRTDMGDHSTIVDADAGAIITINRKNKTYSQMTFEEMAEMMRAAQAKASRDAARAQAEQKKNAENDVQLKYSAKVDATGEKQKIAGVEAKRLFMTVTIDAAARPEDEQEMQQAGSIVLLVDMWNAEDAPHAKAMKSFNEAYAKKAARELGGGARGVEAAFNAYPGVREALEAAGKEMKKVPGVAVRTVTYVVLVPPDQKFDRELALAGNRKSTEKAGEESGGVGKKLGGLMGKLKPQADAGGKEEQAAEATQGTLLTMTTELREVTAGGVPADAFAIPAGYKEQKMK